MERAILKIFFGILVFQHVISAPTDVTLEDIAVVTKADETKVGETKDNGPTLLDDVPKESSAPGQRHKRWYNFYGFPPVNPSFFNRDDSFNTGVFGLQDPLVLIHRRLQDISNSFRQPQPLPPQFPPGFPPIPSFVPIIYVPQVGCACNPETTQRPTTNKPIPPQGGNTKPIPPQDGNNKPNSTQPGDPDIETRWPVMEDERQNWGVVQDDNDDYQDIDEGEGDGSRPISFEPIKPIRPPSRPAPPVEHGSVDSGNAANTPAATTTTSRPVSSTSTPDVQLPSNCDSAVLRCCHLPQVTYDCFAYQGCPDPSSYGNPCASDVISRVIERFSIYYSQRNG